MRRLTVFVDIDHTLSSAHWRDGMIGVTSWDEYHAAAINDEPLSDMVELVRCLDSGGYYLIGLTSRPDKWRVMTINWLMRHGIPMQELLMRPDDDYLPSPELKISLAKERFFNGELCDEVAFVLDDREDVIAVFKEIGVTALQVHARNDEKDT